MDAAVEFRFLVGGRRQLIFDLTGRPGRPPRAWSSIT